MFSFNVTWVPGKTHLIADALSRAPLFSHQEQPDLEVYMAITCLAATSHPSLDVVYSAIDLDYHSLIRRAQWHINFIIFTFITI